MYFYLPTKVYSERDCVRNYASEWTSVGSRALIVTGKSSAKNGALQDVTDALTAAKKEYIIFDGTEENPSVGQIMQVSRLGIDANVDFVIGIGGGSPMDAAKAIALMMANPDETADFLYAKTRAAALPVVEVPTTCGTGSEVTPYSILTIHSKRTKASLPHRIYPAYALVDGKYLQSAGRNVMINTAVDALGHFIESYINTNATSYSRMLCEYGMELWGGAKQVLTGEAAVPEKLDQMMLASTVAGMAIAHTGTALPHGLSYYPTYENHVPHGRAVGYFLPGYLAQADPDICRKVMNLIGFADVQDFQEFLYGLIGHLEASDTLVDTAVAGILANPAKLRNTPFEVTEEKVRAICRAARQ